MDGPEQIFEGFFNTAFCIATFPQFGLDEGLRSASALVRNVALVTVLLDRLNDSATACMLVCHAGKDCRQLCVTVVVLYGACYSR